MKRRVETWSIEKLHKLRPKISFPEYQRQPNLWTVEKKRLLIDSVLNNIDIPKIYLNETADGNYEVVDGTQRLWSIWEFVDDSLTIDVNGETKKFSTLLKAQRDRVRNYELQVTILEDAADDYLRELFIRLQLGLLLVTGEKLHAATGTMKEFVFKKLANHELIAALKIPKRRFAKETLGAQVAINSFTRAKIGTFARTRYEDLIYFFDEYKQPTGNDLKFFRSQSERILQTLDHMSTCFGDRRIELGNRSYFLSAYLLFEEIGATLTTKKDETTFVRFVVELWARLKQEAKSGIDRGNRELYAFETMLSSAPGERYQIERRHEKMIEYFQYFRKTGKIKGD